MKRCVSVWLPVLAWLGVVFAIGSTTALPLNGDPFRWLLRKGIHVGEYAVLGLLLVRAFAPGGFRVNRWRTVLVLGLAVLFASLDEWHQTFVPGRAGRVSDLGIDALGGALGIATAWALGGMWQKASGLRRAPV